MSLSWTLCLLLCTTCDEVFTQLSNRVVFILGTFQNVSVPQNVPVQAVVSRVPPEAAYIILQFHTQHYNVTVSNTQVPNPGSSNTATDSGLLLHLLPPQTSHTWYLLSHTGSPVTGTGVVLPYRSTDPVPGGCPLEDTLDVDPSLHLHYNLFETVLSFASANVGYARGTNSPVCHNSTSPNSHWRLEYDVYQHFLPVHTFSGDLSEQSFISQIQRAAGVKNIRANEKKLVTLPASKKMSVSLRSIPGQGVIYSVVVRDPWLNTSAAYIPAHTYACSFSNTVDNCMTLGKTSTKVFFTVAGLAGIFICFFGHRFFKWELFCAGFAFAAFVFFVLITRTTALNYDGRLALTSLMGATGGVLLVLSWWRFGSVLACLVVVGLILGFLVSSAFFFTPIGDLPIFQSDSVFWVTFSSIVLVVLIVLLRWPRQGNITACGVGGAYAVVLAVNSYVYTSLSYITLDIVKRLLNSSFSRDFTSVPLQGLDFSMITVWVVLGMSGTVVQLYRESSQPCFPPNPYLTWKLEQERRRTNVLDPSHHAPSLASRLRDCRLFRRREPAGEWTPLLF